MSKELDMSIFGENDDLELNYDFVPEGYEDYNNEDSDENADDTVTLETAVPTVCVNINSKPVGFCARLLGITHAEPFQINIWFVST